MADVPSKSVLDGQAEKPVEPDRPANGTCPECGGRYDAVHPNQMFCSTPHRKTFLNRQTVRGAALAPLQMAARISRGGSRNDRPTGIRARQLAEQMIGRWIAEDREAGRMSMIDYVAMCFRKGVRQ